jgi:hypothetical protein
LNSARQPNISKTSRLEEWAKYPLKSSEDVERWWIDVEEKDDYVVSGKFIMLDGFMKSN